MRESIAALHKLNLREFCLRKKKIQKNHQIKTFSNENSNTPNTIQAAFRGKYV